MEVAGYVHRWAAQHITGRAPSVIDGPPEAEILRGGADDANLLDWFRAGHAPLAETLAGADPAPHLLGRFAGFG